MSLSVTSYELAAELDALAPDEPIGTPYVNRAWTRMPLVPFDYTTCRCGGWPASPASVFACVILRERFIAGECVKCGRMVWDEHDPAVILAAQLAYSGAEDDA